MGNRMLSCSLLARELAMSARHLKVICVVWLQMMLDWYQAQRFGIIYQKEA
jgi:hypothetical protein